MMPFICGSVDCQPISMLKADILNITQACKLLMRILCQYFYAFMKKFPQLCEKALFSDFAWSQSHAYTIHMSGEVRRLHSVTCRIHFSLMHFKNCRNQSRFAEVIAKSLLSPFYCHLSLWTTVYVQTAVLSFALRSTEGWNE